MSIFTAAPQGFFTANESLNAMSSAVVGQLIGEVLNVMVIRVGEVSADKYHKLLEDGASHISVVEVESCVNAIKFILRSATAEKVKPDALPAVLSKYTTLNEDTKKLFVEAWTAHSKEGELVGPSGDPLDAVHKCLQLGRLVAFDWKLGLGIASSHCKDLRAPFVTLQLKIADSQGAVQAFPMELNLEEFQALSKTFRDISLQLESV